MGHVDDHAELVRTLAKLEAVRRQIAEARTKVREHASDLLDPTQHAAEVGEQHLARYPNPLIARYQKARATEAHRLRPLAEPVEHDDDA